MRNVQLINEAAHLRATAEALGRLLEEKCLAYGGAHNRQTDIWAAVLKQYEEERDGQAGYWIPDALLYHMPRLTRIFDRIMRIVSNPTADALGEDPWRDLAGDALAGCVMPKPHERQRPCGKFVECELPYGHTGLHRRIDASGLRVWDESGVQRPWNMALDPRVGESRPGFDAQPNPAGFDPELDVAEVAR